MTSLLVLLKLSSINKKAHFVRTLLLVIIVKEHAQTKIKMGTISKKAVTGRKEQHDRKLRKRSLGKTEIDGEAGSLGDQHEADKSEQEESEERGEEDVKKTRRNRILAYITWYIF